MILRYFDDGDDDDDDDDDDRMDIKTNNSLRFYHPPQMRHTYVCPLHMINCSSLLMSFCPVFIAMMPSYVLLR